MKQPRAMSLVEAIANVVVGYDVAMATQILIFLVFSLHTTLVQNQNESRCSRDTPRQTGKKYRNRVGYRLEIAIFGR